MTARTGLSKLSSPSSNVPASSSTPITPSAATMTKSIAGKPCPYIELPGRVGMSSQINELVRERAGVT